MAARIYCYAVLSCLLLSCTFTNAFVLAPPTNLTFKHVTADFGPGKYNITAPLYNLGNDRLCKFETIPNLTGYAVLVERGKCSFWTKAVYSMRKGAEVLIVGNDNANNQDGLLIMSMSDNYNPRYIQIPSIFISTRSYHTIKALFGGAPTKDLISITNTIGEIHLNPDLDAHVKTAVLITTILVCIIACLAGCLHLYRACEKRRARTRRARDLRSLNSVRYYNNDEEDVREVRRAFDEDSSEDEAGFTTINTLVEPPPESSSQSKDAPLLGSAATDSQQWQSGVGSTPLLSTTDSSVNSSGYGGTGQTHQHSTAVSNADVVTSHGDQYHALESDVEEPVRAFVPNSVAVSADQKAPPPEQKKQEKKKKRKKRRKKGKACLNDTCYICLEHFDSGEKIVVLACDHGFHKDCISEWLKLHDNCPTCKLGAFRK